MKGKFFFSSLALKNHWWNGVWHESGISIEEVSRDTLTFQFTASQIRVFTKSAGLGRNKGRRGKHKMTLGFPVPPSITMSISSNLCVDLSL